MINFSLKLTDNFSLICIDYSIYFKIYFYLEQTELYVFVEYQQVLSAVLHMNFQHLQR